MSKLSPEQLRENFWKNDIENGGIIHSQYEEIKRVLAEKDMGWVLKQYNLIKKHAIENTEFYKNYSVDDRFPVVDKSAILSDYEKHKAKTGFDLPLHTSSTSGSTGVPFSVIQDYKKRMRTIADLKAFGDLCDYPSHECMVFFRALSEKIKRTPEQEDRENIYYIDSSSLDESHLDKMVYALYKHKPRTIHSYSSTLVEIAKYVVRAGIDPESFSIKSILTIGEGLSDENRALLEGAFGGKVYRRYSDMELGILGQDMGDGGIYLLNYGSYYFECLKLNSDQPAESGEIGRIVITDLFNYSFPMIRYDTGDLGVMEYPDNGDFPYLKEIYGRKRDCVYNTNGNMVSPAKISVSMWGQENIKQWQFIQETADTYTLKLNCTDKFDSSSIANKLKDALGQDAKIDVVFVDEIPVLSSSKRRAIICNYKKAD